MLGGRGAGAGVSGRRQGPAVRRMLRVPGWRCVGLSFPPSSALIFGVGYGDVHCWPPGWPLRWPRPLSSFAAHPQDKDEVADVLLVCGEAGRGWHWYVKKEKTRQKKEKTGCALLSPASRGGGDASSPPGISLSLQRRRTESPGRRSTKG